MSIPVHGCATYTLKKDFEEKLDGIYTKMLRALSNKCWKQHPTKQQLYGHYPPITQCIYERRSSHAELCWRSNEKLISGVIVWIPRHWFAILDRPANTEISYGGAHGVIVIVVENGYGEPSSNPTKVCLYFT